MIFFRLGKISDHIALAQIHYHSGQFQNDGFMYRLGLDFLKRYYKVLLSGKQSFVLVAEDSSGNLHGFVSGTQNSNSHLSAIRNDRMFLALTLLKRVILSPSILKEILRRYKYVNKINDAESFGALDVARLEYWIWDTDSSSNLSVLLLKAWINIMKEMGVNEIHGEVDKSNI
ncbi:hypothetical protein N9M75_03380, partial [Schleiferiaceae bacterium]|nr:hypothetical protein [Schleiferiaceae bacterium]